MRDVKLALQRSDDSWEATLSRWLLRQHITPHSTTAVSPSELTMGRIIRSRLDLLHPDVRKGVIGRQVNQKENHDDKVKSDRRFDVSDPVFARNYGVGLPWAAGTVVGVDGPVSYAIEMENGRIWRRHIDQLRRRLNENTFTGPPAIAADVAELVTDPEVAAAEGATTSTRLDRPQFRMSSSAAERLMGCVPGPDPVAMPPGPGLRVPLTEVSERGPLRVPGPPLPSEAPESPRSECAGSLSKTAARRCQLSSI